MILKNCTVILYLHLAWDTTPEYLSAPKNSCSATVTNVNSPRWIDCMKARTNNHVDSSGTYVGLPPLPLPNHQSTNGFSLVLDWIVFTSTTWMNVALFDWANSFNVLLLRKRYTTVNGFLDLESEILSRYTSPSGSFFASPSHSRLMYLRTWMGQLLLVTTLSGCYYYYMYSLRYLYTRFVVCSIAVRFLQGRLTFVLLWSVGFVMERYASCVMRHV